MKFCMSMRLKKAHHLKNFSLMHLRSLLIYILLGKNKEGGAGLFIIFPSACCAHARARERERESLEFLLSIVFFCVLLFCLILTTKIMSLYSPWLSFLLSLANTLSTLKRKIIAFGRQCTMQDVQ